MLDIISTAALFGLSAGVAPGPLLVLVVAETLSHGVRQGIRVAVAPVITDFPIILLALFAVSKLASLETTLGWLSVAGGLFVFYLAYENEQLARKTGKATDVPPGVHKADGSPMMESDLPGFHQNEQLARKTGKATDVPPGVHKADGAPTMESDLPGFHISHKAEGFQISEAGASSHSLKKGILVNLLNPHPYLFWFTVGAPILINASRISAYGAFFFVGGFYFFLVGSKVAIALLAGRSQTFLTGKGYPMIMRVLAVLLFLFAFKLIRDGLRLLGCVDLISLF